MTFAAVCCYYCHQATRGATAHLEPETLNDMDQPNAMESGLLRPENQICTRWTTDCANKPDIPYDDNGAQLGAVHMDLGERRRILRMINAQCNGVDIDTFIEVVKLGEDYYILRISTPTCMRREKVIRFLRDHGYHVNTESEKTAPGEGCHRTVTYIYNYRIDFKGNLTELADDVALISGYWKTQSQRDRKKASPHSRNVGL
jgi:hypothetical protein